MTNERIRRMLDTTLLLASPSCVNHSLAKGAKTLKERSLTLFEAADPELAECGPPGLAEAEKSRATVNDVARFVEQKALAGRPYLGVIVENVVEMVKHGIDGDGRYYRRWRNRILKAGYDHEVVYHNSMFAPPVSLPGHPAPRFVAQSRDRVFVVFWRRGIKKPDLSLAPPSWCQRCEEIVGGLQAFKKWDEPWGRYDRQWFYVCPGCYDPVLPGAAPAASILDFSIPAPLIGERERPLKPATRERIRRGLTRLASEPFELRIMRGRPPKPLTAPLVHLGPEDPRADAAMVIPVAGNTHENSPGNRARAAATRPLDTVHATGERALVMANTENNVPRDAGAAPTQTLRTEGGLALVTRTGHKTANGTLARDASADPALMATTASDLALVVGNRTHGRPRDSYRHPSQTVCTGETLGVVEVQNNGSVRRPGDPAHTVRAGGKHHGVVVANYSPGWSRKAHDLPIGSVTTRDHHAFLAPYSTKGVAKRAATSPADTLTALNKASLAVPYYKTGTASPAHAAASPTLTTKERLALVIPPTAEGPATARGPRESYVPSEAELDQCGFRMFTVEEIARAMGMDLLPDGSPFVVFGNKAQRIRQYGNAVVPATMAYLVSRLLAAIDGNPEGGLRHAA